MKSSSRPINPPDPLAPSPETGKKTTQAKAPNRANEPLSVIDLVLFGLLTAVLVAVQVGLAFLPNIELVTPLLILYTLFLGKKVFIPLYAFVLLEGIIWGFGMWWISYLYVWAVLVIIVLLLKKLDSALLFAVAAAIFGLLFGTMTSLPYLFIGGWPMFLSTVTAGLTFDFIHCAGNFAGTLLLYHPLKTLLIKLYKNPKQKQE